MSFYNPVYLHAAGVYAVYLKNKAVAYIKGIKHRRARKLGLAQARQRWGDQQAVMDALALARANATTPEALQALKAQQYMFLYGSSMWPLMVAELKRGALNPAAQFAKALLTRAELRAILDTETTGGSPTGRLTLVKEPSPSWEGHFQGLSPEVQREQDRLMQDLQRKLKHRREMSIGQQARRELVDTPQGVRSLPVQPTPQARRDYGVKADPEAWEIVYVQNPAIEGHRRQGLWKYVAYAKTGERLTCMTQDTTQVNQWLKELRVFQRTAVNGEYLINKFM